jgi:hypothetical protein
MKINITDSKPGLVKGKDLKQGDVVALNYEPDNLRIVTRVPGGVSNARPHMLVMLGSGAATYNFDELDFIVYNAEVTAWRKA